MSEHASETPTGLELPGDVPSPTLLRLAQKHLTCQSTGGPEAYCLRHGDPFTSAWPCEDSQSLAALLAQVDREARAEGAAGGIEGLMHELACHRDAELAARRADQWRAQAEQMRADQ